MPTQMGLGIKSPTCDLGEAHSDHSRDRTRMVLAKCSVWVLKKLTGVVGWGGVGVMGILYFNCWLDHFANNNKIKNKQESYNKWNFMQCELNLHFRHT